MSGTCAIAPAPLGRPDRAKRVAKHLNLPFVHRLEAAETPVVLIVDETDAWLIQTGRRDAGPVRVDFADPAMKYRRKGGQNELLGRAVGVRGDRRPRVFDATAGLGRDSYVLADLGCDVTLSERSPVLGFLLQAGIDAAAINGDAKIRAAAARMQLLVGDSVLKSVPEGTVIYLDPMFPTRRSNAAVRKDLATLQYLHSGEGLETEALLNWALSQPCPRIVVKRPPREKPLCNMPVSHSISGKAVRFDVLVRSMTPQ